LMYKVGEIEQSFTQVVKFKDEIDKFTINADKFARAHVAIITTFQETTKATTIEESVHNADELEQKANKMTVAVAEFAGVSENSPMHSINFLGNKILQRLLDDDYTAREKIDDLKPQLGFDPHTKEVTIVDYVGSEISGTSEDKYRKEAWCYFFSQDVKDGKAAKITIKMSVKVWKFKSIKDMINCGKGFGVGGIRSQMESSGEQEIVKGMLGK